MFVSSLGGCGGGFDQRGPEAGGGYGLLVAGGGFGAGGAGGCGGTGAGANMQGGSLGGFLVQGQEGHCGPEQGEGHAAGGQSAGVGSQRHVDTLTPVTIRMLCDAVKQNGVLQQGPDQPYIVNNRELGLLSLVACVESVSQQGMLTDYKLNDSTGRLNAHWYTGSDGMAVQLEIRRGDYVRVIGTLRSWKGQDGLNVHTVRKVDDSNEIAYHFIEVAHAHLSLTGKLVKAAPAAAAASAAPGPVGPYGSGGMPAPGPPHFGTGGGVPGGDLPQQHQQQLQPPPQHQLGTFGGAPGQPPQQVGLGGGAPGGFQQQQQQEPLPSQQLAAGFGARVGAQYGPRPGGPCGGGGSASGASYPPPNSMGAQWGVRPGGSGGPYGGSSGGGGMPGQGGGFGGVSGTTSNSCPYGPACTGQGGSQGAQPMPGCGHGQSPHGAPPQKQGARMGNPYGGGAGFGGSGGAAGGPGGGNGGFY